MSPLTPAPRVRGAPIPWSSPLHPSKGELANLRLDPAVDCAFRSVAIEVVTARQPVDAVSNWTQLAESAFQMEQCANYNYSQHTAASDATSRTAAPAVPRAPQPAACAHELFVDAALGDDAAVGSNTSPLRSVPAALTALRRRRAADAGQTGATACITLRGGRHYLGSVDSSTLQAPRSSRVGAVQLTAADSNLVLQGAEDEVVVLSGGVELGPLKWTVWKTVAAGDIMRATLPASLPIDDDMFNELYTDGAAAVRAKTPNGQPRNQTTRWRTVGRNGAPATA